jgi:hypothetical protein
MYANQPGTMVIALRKLNYGEALEELVDCLGLSQNTTHPNEPQFGIKAYRQLDRAWAHGFSVGANLFAQQRVIRRCANKFAPTMPDLLTK